MLYPFLSCDFHPARFIEAEPIPIIEHRTGFVRLHFAMPVECQRVAVYFVERNAQGFNTGALVGGKHSLIEPVNANGNRACVAPFLRGRNFLQVAAGLDCAILTDKKMIADAGPSALLVPPVDSFCGIVRRIVGCATMQEYAKYGAFWFLYLS